MDIGKMNLDGSFFRKSLLSVVAFALGGGLAACGLDGLFDDNCKPGEICEGEKPFEQTQDLTAEEIFARYFPKTVDVVFENPQDGAPITSATYSAFINVSGTLLLGNKINDPKMEVVSLNSVDDPTIVLPMVLDNRGPASWSAGINMKDYIVEQHAGEYIASFLLMAQTGQGTVYSNYVYDADRSQEFYVIVGGCRDGGTCIEEIRDSSVEQDLAHGLVSDVPLSRFFLEETKSDVYAAINSVTRNGTQAIVNFTIFNNSDVPVSRGVHYAVWANRTEVPAPGSPTSGSADSGTIAANSQVVVNFIATGFTLGIENTAYVVVDDINAIDESNEDNNVASMNWTP